MRVRNEQQPLKRTLKKRVSYCRIKTTIGGFFMKHIPQTIVLEMLEMRLEGKTHREIADCTCYTKKQVSKFFERQNKKARMGEIPGISKRGRSRNTPATLQQALELRVKELEREVELYKSFLHAAGRM
jgi:hypothetical protein